MGYLRRMSPTPLVQEIIRNAIARTKLSLRVLAKRIGLKGHSALSAYLAGRRTLSTPTLLRLFDLLEVTDTEYDTLLSSLIDPDVLERLSRRLEDGVLLTRQPVGAPVVELLAGTPFDTRAMHPLLPPTFEIVRLLGRGTKSDVVAAFRRVEPVDRAGVETCLAQLAQLGLVHVERDAWRFEHQRDFVVQSSQRFRRRHMRPIVSGFMQRAQQGVRHDSKHVFVRAAFMSARLADGESVEERYKDRVHAFLAGFTTAQTDDDASAIGVLVAVQELARVR
jgi:transcriptional regulator with XRE-family HTH domain